MERREVSGQEIGSRERGHMTKGPHEVKESTCIGGNSKPLKISQGTGFRNRVNKVVRDHWARGNMPNGLRGLEGILA